MLIQCVSLYSMLLNEYLYKTVKVVIMNIPYMKDGCNSEHDDHKVSLCENCHRQSCKAFIGLTMRAKMIRGGLPLKRAFCIKWTFPWRVSSADQHSQEIWWILCLLRNYYTVSGKKVREMLTDFQNSFTIALCSKFAVKKLINILP